MKKSAIFLLILLFISTADAAAAETETAPPGMRIEKVGDLEIMVPEGAKIERTGKGGLLSIESTEKYVSRKLLEAEENFKRLEKEQAALRDEIKRLRGEIERLRESVDKLQREKPDVR